MRTQRTLLLVLLLTAGVAACAAPRAESGAETAGSRPERVKRNPSRITAEEIDPARFRTAFNVVQSLRPQWLNVRGRSSITRAESGVRVFHNGVLVGGAEYLNQVAANSVRLLEYISAIDATQRWGVDFGNGAIVVHTTDAR
jgi:hypothetical protein